MGLLRRIGLAFLAFGLLGGLAGLQNVGVDGKSTAYAFFEGFLGIGLLAATVGGVVAITLSEHRPLVRILLNFTLSAGSATSVAYFFHQFGVGEVMEPVSAGWGHDRSTYRQYGFRGYELVAVAWFAIPVLLVLFLEAFRSSLMDR